jgi:hypothetical protein
VGAGQSVVQMARSRQGGEVYAIKFFLDRREFSQELALHEDLANGTRNPLTQFLPKVRSCMYTVKMKNEQCELFISFCATGQRTSDNGVANEDGCRSVLSWRTRRSQFSWILRDMHCRHASSRSARRAWMHGRRAPDRSSPPP